MIKIPGKTFLLGEYAVLQYGTALIICTQPYFTLDIVPPNNKKKLIRPFHPESAAGKFIQDHAAIFDHHDLMWSSPYPQGGFGGSTAEFLACYQHYYQQTKNNAFTGTPDNLNDLYKTYITYAYHGIGVPPSGADLIAQTQKKIVYVQKESTYNGFSIIQNDWPFQNLSLLLFKTPYKLATHHYLATLNTDKKNNLPDFSVLFDLTQKGYQALHEKNQAAFIDTINAYAIELDKLDLTAAPTQQLLERLRTHPACLAIKGCGAMGADVIAVMVPRSQEKDFIQAAQAQRLILVATQGNLD